MISQWTFAGFLLVLVKVNAQYFNYGQGTYYNPLTPQRSNVQHFRVERVNFQPFAAPNHQYIPAATPQLAINAFPQQQQQQQHHNANHLVFKGDYISQSEAGQLDQSAYPYKQRIAGDTRPFKRFVTTCYPGGHCDNQQGNVDVHHQEVLYQFRAQIQNNQQHDRTYLPPAGAPPCQADQKLANTQFEANASPPARRLYPYYEAVSSISFN